MAFKLIGCKKSWEIHAWQFISFMVLGVAFLLYYASGEVGVNSGDGGAILRIFGVITGGISGLMLIGTAVFSFFDHGNAAKYKGAIFSHKLMSFMTVVLFVLWLQVCHHCIPLIDSIHSTPDVAKADTIQWMIDQRLPAEVIASLGGLYGTHTLYTLSNWTLSNSKSDMKDQSLSLKSYLKFLAVLPVMPLALVATPFLYLCGGKGAVHSMVNKIYGFEDVLERSKVAPKKSPRKELIDLIKETNTDRSFPDFAADQIEQEEKKLDDQPTVTPRDEVPATADRDVIIARGSPQDENGMDAEICNANISTRTCTRRRSVDGLLEMLNYLDQRPTDTNRTSSLDFGLGLKERAQKQQEIFDVLKLETNIDSRSSICKQKSDRLLAYELQGTKYRLGGRFPTDRSFAHGKV